MVSQNGFSPDRSDSITRKAVIRRVANRCGGMMIAVILLIRLLFDAIGRFGPALWRSLPDVFTNLFSYSDLVTLFCNVVIYLVSVPLLLRISNRKSGVRTVEYLRFPQMPGRKVAKLVIMGIGVVWLAAQGANTVYQTIRVLLQLLFNITMNPISQTVAITPSGIAALVLSAAVLAPLFEELLTRVGIFGAIAPHGGIFAAITCGILFGFMHTHFQQVYYAIMMGIFAGLTVYLTHSVWPAILTHFTVNLLSVIQMIGLNCIDITPAYIVDLSDSAQSDPTGFFLRFMPVAVTFLISLLQTVLGIIGIVLLFRSALRAPILAALTDERSATGLGLGEKCKTFFTAPAILLFIGISLFLSFCNAFL